MKEHYLDNSATTKAHGAVIEKVSHMLSSCYANPSSLHAFGMRAQAEVEKARESVAESINADPREIYFTSGGTEGDNWAAICGAAAKSRLGKKIITTAAEHPAVLAAFDYLAKNGFDATIIPLKKGGEVDILAYEAALSEDTALVSAMMVNNELGTLFPIKEMAFLLKKKSPDALFHCDAVQGYGKMPIDVNSLGADLLTLSSHKIHGPKGVGALYIRRGVHLPPLLYGGGQESALRSGTENVPGIAGFGLAASMMDVQKNMAHFKALNLYLRDKLEKELPSVKINSSLENSSAHILTVSLPPFRSETLVHALEADGVYVSSGSACSSKKARAPYLLKAGFAPDLADSAIRVSFGEYNTTDDIDALVEGLKKAEKTLLGRLK